MSTERILDLIRAERARQEENYGEVMDDRENGTGPETRWLLPYTKDSAELVEAELRDDYEAFTEEVGLPTWCHLVREEIAEAFKEDDPFLLAEELIQAAALCASWVERLQQDTRGWRWGVRAGDTVVGDEHWHCAADVMRSTHGFERGVAYCVVVMRPGETEWSNFWTGGVR